MFLQIFLLFSILLHFPVISNNKNIAMTFNYMI